MRDLLVRFEMYCYKVRDLVRIVLANRDVLLQSTGFISAIRDVLLQSAGFISANREVLL